MRQLVLWTNMYPTRLAPYYGTFVRSTEQAWRKSLGAENVQLVAIRDKPVGALQKIYFYAELMIKCFLSIYRNPKGAILEIHYPVYFLPVLYAAKIFKRRNYLVLRFHGNDLKQIINSKFFMYLYRSIKSQVDLYVVPSDFYREKVSKNLKVPIERVIKVFPDCVGAEFADTSLDKPANDSERFVLGFVSRLERKKNCHELIEAFAKLKIPNAHLVIAGDGSQRKNLEDLAEERGVSSSVTFLGAVPRERLPNIMSQFSVFIFPSVSKTESFGLVAIEALACGAPVIANEQLEAASEYLEVDRNGYYYSGGVEGLCHAIETFYALAGSKKIALATHARTVVQRFDYDRVFTRGVEKILSSLNR
ncbi:glycosyltransferase family 4 protein [Vreelandella profundi]|uniref:glycosyltransferase family 4 protein n=1 Tax=Vreelandella profundi TaxID=2852117 RepID=UPI001EF11460|nr:glycosyltransferase family 4 protein [Halomonas profundi]